MQMISSQLTHLQRYNIANLNIKIQNRFNVYLNCCYANVNSEQAHQNRGAKTRLDAVCTCFFSLR